jgi:protein-disulfide isomerase
MRIARQGSGLRRFAAVLVVAGLTAGCAGETGLPSFAVEATAPPAASVALSASSTPDKTQFNPFADASTQAVGGREVIVNPTVAEIMQPASELPEITIGRADAPVTIIKYESMTCPYCRQFQADVYPKLKREYIDTGKVRFILREFPIGKQSGSATIAMRCAPASKQFALYEKFMAQQSAWVSQEVRLDPIFKVASQVGMTREQFDACFANQAMVAGLNANKERGRTLGIIGTPNFFIQGKLVKSTLDMAKIRAFVDPILAGRTAG